MDLKEIQESTFTEETLKKFEEMVAKKNQYGYLDLGILTYEDVVAVFRGIGEMLDFDTSWHEYDVLKNGNGPISNELLADRNNVLTEYRFGHDLKAGLARQEKQIKAGDYQFLGYGFRVWANGMGPKNDELTLEAREHLSSVGVPIVKAAHLI